MKIRYPLELSVNLRQVVLYRMIKWLCVMLVVRVWKRGGCEN